MAVIPPGFRGEWNRTLADCRSGPPESRLVLWADRVVFGESAGPVQSVTRPHDDEVGIAVDLSDEGRRWTAHHRFRLSGDGRRLTDIGSGGRIRYRCE